MMAGYIDTHTHIYLEEFDADSAEVVSRARAAGAEALFLPNIDATSVAPMLRLCEAYPGFCFPMLGLHPTELPPDPRPVLDEMERMLTADRRFIAVGEVGLDFYWDDSRRDEQIEVFRRQVEWAVRFRLPLMIHCRSAHHELVDVLRPYAEKLAGGVFHCFGGTADEARELLAFPGFALGIGGVVTFKKSSLPSVLAEVPLGRLVLETDAPYLAPAPHRGRRNEPAFIPLVIERLSAVYGVAPGEIVACTTATARRLFLDCEA